MEKLNYTASIKVDATPQEVFNCINSVKDWWTENVEGRSQKVNDEFSVRFGDVHYSKQKLVEVLPNKKVVWLVTDSSLNWLTDKHEWTNTKISFEIISKGPYTQLIFTHIGLNSGLECYEDCSSGWNQYIKDSLFKLLAEGKGQPELRIKSIV